MAYDTAIPDPVWSLLKPRDMELGPTPGEAAPRPYANWTVTRDGADVAWAIWNQPGRGANTVTEAVLTELDAILAGFEAAKPRGLVIRSSKPSGFAAGADIGEFSKLKTAEEVEERLRRAHAVVDRLAALTIPTVAVVHGFCLGGGLELALACHQRIGVQGSSYGFPEVQLGLIPGLGGVARFTRLIDPLVAMEAMLTGRTLHDRKAKALGLIDALVPERHVQAAVTAAMTGKLEPHTAGVVDRLKDSGPARRFAAGRMRQEAAKKAPPQHYPAPGALIDLWEAHGGDPAALRAGESRTFARLLTTETSRNLVRVFFLRETLKGLAGKPPPVAQVHVIGAGAMGGDIAAWCAWRGLRVTVGDVAPAPIAGAVKRAAELYGKLSRGARGKRRDALDRLIPDPRGEGIRTADLIIEAAPERLDLKHRIYADVESKMKPGAVLATNTSSIPLQQLAQGLKRPERLVGLHFFNPVSMLPLVEVIRHEGLDPAVEAFARGFVGRIDKLPAPCESRPGFIVNRALTPYLAEALILMDEGVAPETIDAAAEGFGMPVGPIELSDQVGLDIAVAVAGSLKRDLGWPLPDAPDWLKAKVERKELGRKTGKGIYPWEAGRAVKAKSFAPPPPDMADRLILPMLNTCAALLREGVAADPDIVDAAMIFGSGFAPFRGGPLHYARQRGIDEVVAGLAELEARYGERFRPDPGWDALR